MAAITVNRFGGSTPRIAPHLLPGAGAAKALDCRLWHGRLESWRVPLAVRTPEEGTLTSYLYDCCWFDFDACVDVAVGPVNCRKLFVTGATDWPAVIELAPTEEDPCASTLRRLGVPCADAAPSVLVGALGSSAPRDSEGRSYAYLYVNAAGERGALSKGSEPQVVRDGQTVVISGWQVPDASWGVTHVQIYRTVSGYQPTGRESGNVLDTVWMLVGTAAIGAASFTDTVLNELLISALEEDVADPPPAELQGIVHIDGMNVLAGFVGKRVYFSENNSYHQWPYYLDLDDNVRGLAQSNGVLYVATDGHPYAIEAAVDCQSAGCRNAVRLPLSFPMVGWGNRRMAALPQGAVYPSHDGLVALGGRSAPVLLTHPFYAPDDWQRLHPSTLVPVVHQGKLFVFARNGAFVMTLPSGPEAGWPLDSHSELSDRGILQAFTSRQGDLYLLTEAGQVLQWDRGTTKRPHKWVSADFVTPLPVNFGAGHLVHQHGAESVTIEADQHTPFQRQVLSPRAFRLPNWIEGTRWRITLEGTATVSLFSLATSMQELGA